MDGAGHTAVVMAVSGAAPEWNVLLHHEQPEVRLCAGPDAVLRFDELVQRHPKPVAVVIEAGMTGAEHLARHAHRLAPSAQVVFLVLPEQLGRFEARLRLLPLMSAHWALVPLRPGWPEVVTEQIEVGIRRRRYRTTLDRVNLKLRETAAIDGHGLRRLVVSERFLSAIVATASDPIVSLRPGGEILSWNAAAERLWRRAPSEALGENFLELLTPTTRGLARDSLDRVVQRGAPEEIEVGALVPGAHEPVPLELHLAAVMDDAQSTAAISVIARDLSDRKRAEQLARNHQAELESLVAERTARLTETIAQLEQFSYTVSHDLRAPLRAMAGYADVLLNEFGSQLPANAVDYTRRIARAAGRLDRLTMDVLAYSRVNSMALQKRRISLDDLVADLIAQYASPHAGDAFVVRRPLHHVLGHDALLAQAVGNLIGNALKFVAPGEKPRVEISAERLAQTVRLSIRDHGIGISPLAAQRLFQIFERGDVGKQYEGTGIGLAIVKKSIERLGGSVAYAPAPGGGSIFTLELPVADV